VRLASCHFDRSGEISFYFELWHAITVSGFISSQSVIVRDVSTSVDMTELRSTATSRILLPMKLRHSLVREQVHWRSRGSPSFWRSQGRLSIAFLQSRCRPSLEMTATTLRRSTSPLTASSGTGLHRLRARQVPSPYLVCCRPIRRRGHNQSSC